MNEFTHFLTGYLIIKIIQMKEDKKRKYEEFECLLGGLAGFILDIDYAINLFIPFEHGVWTHTIVGALFIAFILASISRLFALFLTEKNEILFRRLLIIAVIGIVSHLILDLVPYLPDDPIERVKEMDHHMYFWPLSTFPVHLNVIFPSYTYTHRLIIEIVYTVIIASYLVLIRWFKEGDLFLNIFIPRSKTELAFIIFSGLILLTEFYASYGYTIPIILVISGPLILGLDIKIIKPVQKKFLNK